LNNRIIKPILDLVVKLDHVEAVQAVETVGIDVPVD
jgi:hypothetical protein